MSDAYVYAFADATEMRGPARRQGRQARRDDAASACRCRRGSRSRPGPACTRTRPAEPGRTACGAGRRALARSRSSWARRFGDADNRCSSRCARGARRLDARDDGDDPQPRPERRDRRGAGRARRATRASPTTPTAASSRCSATSCCGVPSHELRARARRGEGRARRRKPTPSSGATTCAELVDEYKRLVARAPGSDVPAGSARAAARSRSRRCSAPGTLERARWTTARMHSIPDDLGTAVNVMPMVFGNLRRRLGHRRRASPAIPSTGEHALLRRVPAERAGRGRRRRHPHARADRRACASCCPRPTTSSSRPSDRLERHYRDMQDIEFTVEQGKLYMLQTRNGKRTARPPCASRATWSHEGVIDAGRGRAARRAARSSTSSCTRVSTPPSAASSAVAPRACPPRPGAAVGEAVFDADTAAERGAAGEAVILVRCGDDARGHPRHDRRPQGILTVARRHDAPRRRRRARHGQAVRRRRARRITIDDAARTFDGRRRRSCARATWITIDGATGDGHARRAAARGGRARRATFDASRWAGPTSAAACSVRANADTPEDARAGARVRRRGHRAVPHRAHVLRRRPHPRRARDDPRDRRPEARRAALERAAADAARRTSRASSRRWTGCPVTIRLLDPPLHEFLPARASSRSRAALARRSARARRLERLAERARSSARRTRCSATAAAGSAITHPEIYEMQVRAIFEAARSRAARGRRGVKPEIMIPLVGHAERARAACAQLVDEADATSVEAQGRARRISSAR